MTIENGSMAEGAFRLAIHQLHDCEAEALVEIVPVRILSSNGFRWEGEVRVYDLSGHQHATRCYTWPKVVNRTTTEILVVLQSDEISSPEEAVQSVLLNTH